MGKKDDYDREIEALQLGLVQFQQRAIEAGEKDLVIFEGRDTAGKDGAIKRIVEHLSIRQTRVVALPKPTEREQTQWYFQRYTAHLPAVGELVILNRSWYNRGGVERVMGFSTLSEQEVFLRDAPIFERLLTDGGLQVVKLWLDISREEQARRLDARRSDPLKALKVSPLDAVAQEKWDAYSAARDEMLARTHSEHAPWTIVKTDDKRQARLNILRFLLKALAPELGRDAAEPDPEVVFAYSPEAGDRLFR
jgi:polyphosphate kinase 2